VKRNRNYSLVPWRKTNEEVYSRTPRPKLYHDLKGQATTQKERGSLIKENSSVCWIWFISLIFNAYSTKFRSQMKPTV